MSNRLEQLEFKLERIIGIQKTCRKSQKKYFNFTNLLQYILFISKIASLYIYLHLVYILKVLTILICYSFCFQAHLEAQYIYQDSKILASFMQLAGWSGAEIKCTMHYSLPKRPINNHTRAIISHGLYFFLPHFSLRLILQSSLYFRVANIS